MTRRIFATLFTILGVITFVMIVAFVVLLLVVGVGGGRPAIPANARLTLPIGGDLVEIVPDDVVGLLQGSRTPTVGHIVEALRKAKVDTRIRSVLLKPTGLTTPYWGKVQEIRDAIIDFRKSGKPVYAYMEYASDKDYYLASAADKIFLMPSSPLDLTGVATYELFLRGTLDKIGVVPDIHGVGEYKTAPNTFTEKGFTPTQREMDASLSRDLYEQIVQGVAEGRKKTVEDVRRLIDDGPFLAEQAVEAGLIDEVAYEDQVADQLAKLSPEGERRLDADDYGQVTPRSLGLNKGPRIAVIHVAGTIVSGASGFDPLQGSVIGSDSLIQTIRRVRQDSSFRAIVLRIDSPGGSATASDAIWRELMLARTEKEDRPIVASMSDLAASGGYYVALPAEVIVAQPSTLTGSIGVYGGKFTTGGLYKNLGANVDSVSIGKRAEINSPVRPYNADELTKVNEGMKAFYDQFVQKVAESRKSTAEKIDRLARGRVWTGRQAKENGLVDALGGMATAVGLAKERAGIAADSDVELVEYPVARSLYEVVVDQLTGGGQSAAVGAWVASHLSASEVDLLRALHGPFTLFRRGEPLALMPIQLLR